MGKLGAWLFSCGTLASLCGTLASLCLSRPRLAEAQILPQKSVGISALRSGQNLVAQSHVQSCVTHFSPVVMQQSNILAMRACFLEQVRKTNEFPYFCVTSLREPLCTVPLTPDNTGQTQQPVFWAVLKLPLRLAALGTPARLGYFVNMRPGFDKTRGLLRHWPSLISCMG